MKESETIFKYPNLEKYGLKNANAHWNLSPEELQKITVEKKWGVKQKMEL